MNWQPRENNIKSISQTQGKNCESRQSVTGKVEKFVNQSRVKKSRNLPTGYEKKVEFCQSDAEEKLAKFINQSQEI